MTTSAREESARLFDLLRCEQRALAEFLVALADFDRRRVWIELGHASLFAFLHRELGLSAGAAYYRKTAAELIQKFPEVVEPLRDGRLCFTSIVELSKNLTPENRAEVLPRFFHVSKREAKAITAELQPADAVPSREVVTSVRPPVESPTLALAADLAFHPDETPRASSERPTQERAPRPAPPPRVAVEPKTAEESRLHITVSRQLLHKLEDARDALSHSHPGADAAAIIEVGLDLILERQAKRRGLVKNPRKKAAPPTPTPAPRSRYVPAGVRRAVWERDHGQCQYPLASGGICGATYQVEIDHIDGWALGGETSVEAMRVLCKPHQDVHARALYGNDLMNHYTRPKGDGCSEPVAAYLGSSATNTPCRFGCTTR